MADSQPDLAAVFDAHVAAEFTTQDLEATMATMTETPHLTHVPVMTGGQGREEVRNFYGSYFIGHWPADLTITPVSRTIGTDRVVDEVVLTFTHDIEMPAILPGVAPTGRRVEAAFLCPRRLQERQGFARAHLLGPSVDPGADRPARSRLAAGDGEWEQARRILAPEKVPAKVERFMRRRRDEILPEAAGAAPAGQALIPARPHCAYTRPSRPAEGVELETFLFEGGLQVGVLAPQRKALLPEARRAHPVSFGEGETPETPWVCP